MILISPIEAALPTELWLGIGLIVASLSIFLIIYFFFNKKSILQRELRKSPPKPFYSVKDGEYVRLHGKVVAADENLRSPLMQEPCVIYEVDITVKKNDGDATVRKEHDACSFTIEDADHKAKIIIKHKNAFTYHITPDLQMTSEHIKVPRKNYKEFLKSYNITIRDGLFNQSKRLHFKESVLRISDTVAVKGQANWQTDLATGQRQLVLTASPKHKLLITDDPKVIMTIPKSK